MLREDVSTDDNNGECLIASNRSLSVYILAVQYFFITSIGANSDGDIGISFSVVPQKGDCVAKIGPDNNNNNNNNIINNNNNTDDRNQSMKGNLVQIKANPVSVEEKAVNVDLDEANLENEHRPLCAKPSTATIMGRCKGFIFL